MKLSNPSRLHPRTITIKSVCVFCGSRDGKGTLYIDAAKRIGRLLGERRIKVIYGGASVGLMNVVANATIQAGGEVMGIITHLLMEKEVGHNGLTALEKVATMHERKARMAELSDAFIALPGGFGTLEEVFEQSTWKQLGIHPKPIGILNTNQFYAHLRRHINHSVKEEFLSHEVRNMITVKKNPDELLQAIGAGEHGLFPASA